jgi:type I restriction enzyme M protein
VSLRKLLLESCNLHTVLDLPAGTFAGAGVKTVVLFFEKGKPTKKIWFYQLNLDRNLGKGKPLTDADLEEFVKLQKNKTLGQNSWVLDVAEIDKNTFDLAAKNPSKKDQAVLREPKEILGEIATLDTESKKVIAKITHLL